MADVATIHAARDAHIEREGFWAHGEVTPQREDQTRRATDASRLTFPLQMVIVIVGGILATVGSFWIATSSLRSDVRDILTRMEFQANRDIDWRRLQEERVKDLKEALDEEKRQRSLLRYDLEAKIKELTDKRSRP